MQYPEARRIYCPLNVIGSSEFAWDLTQSLGHGAFAIVQRTHSGTPKLYLQLDTHGRSGYVTGVGVRISGDPARAGAISGLHAAGAGLPQFVPGIGVYLQDVTTGETPVGVASANFSGTAGQYDTARDLVAVPASPFLFEPAKHRLFIDLQGEFGTNARDDSLTVYGAFIDMRDLSPGRSW